MLAGKTLLTDALVKQMRRDGREVLSAFLTYRCDATYISVLQSLLFQALKNDRTCRPMVHELHRLRHHTDLERLQELLSDILNVPEQRFIAVDGLDEVEKIAGTKILEALLGVLRICPNLKLLISSRDEYEIRRLLEPRSMCLRVDQNNKREIQEYTRRRGENFIGELEDMGVDQVTSTEIKNSIQSIAERANGRSLRPCILCCADIFEGMFLYARLVMDVVTEMLYPEDICTEIRNLPDGLDKAYVLYHQGGEGFLPEYLANINQLWTYSIPNSAHPQQPSPLCRTSHPPVDGMREMRPETGGGAPSPRRVAWKRGLFKRAEAVS